MFKKILKISAVIVILLIIAVISLYYMHKDKAFLLDAVFEGDKEGFIYYVDEKKVDPNDPFLDTNLLSDYVIYNLRNIDLEFVKLMLDKGVSQKMNNKKGYSTIFFAILFNNYNLAKLLIEYNPDVNIETDNGTTPLIFALQGERCEIAKLLFDNGGTLGDSPEEWILKRLEKCKTNNWISTDKTELD